MTLSACGKWLQHISPEALAAGGWRPNAIYALRPRSIEVTMAKSETAQWAGLRFLYLAITGVVWICGGEIAFFVATLAMRRFLAGIDRPPELAEIDASVDGATKFKRELVGAQVTLARLLKGVSGASAARTPARRSSIT